MYEITDINKTLDHVLPNNLKVTITIDDIRLKSNSKINRTLTFTKKSFSYTISEFVHFYSGELGDIDGFIQLISG